ncbi:MAG: cation:proton antiporter [Myxococcales bacterium]
MHVRHLVADNAARLPQLIEASAGTSTLVSELGMCLLAAGFLSAIFERLRIPTIAALLVAGVMVGPAAGFGLVHSASDVETIANLGLTLLLFVIGLEVNPRSLLASGRTLLLGGALQVPLTIVAALGTFYLLTPLIPAGFGGRYTVVYFALASAFSSTLLVVRFLQERRWLDSLSGRIAVGLLIFQDIWAIVVLALQPSFEAPEVAPILLTFGGIVLLVGIATLGARYALPFLFSAVAKLPDLMVSVALAWCFFVGLIGGNLGNLLKLLGIHIPLSVSLEMGALIAGMTIASFPYHHDVAAKVTNLRDFFVTLFFVALGMSIPVPEGTHVLALALLLAVVAVVLRLLVFFPLLYFTGLDRNTSVDASLKLGQISEFCLVIVYLGVKEGHVDGRLASVVIFAFVITALLTPALFKASTVLPFKLGPLLERIGFKAPADRPSKTPHDAHPRIVILGFHRVAFALLQDINRQHPEWLSEVLVVDTNVQTHAAIRELGARVVYGDAGNPETLRHAHVETAALIISTVSDELLRGTSNEAIVRAVRSVSKDALVFACASRAKQVDVLLAAGANHVFLPAAETANGVLAAAASALAGQLDDFRAKRESATGSMTGRVDVEGMSL